MLKIKIYPIYIWFMGILMLFPSCTDHFEELNTPPTSVTAIDPGFVFSELIRNDQINYNYEWQNARIMGAWVQHWAAVSQDNGLPNYYSPDRRIEDGLWSNSYEVLRNAERAVSLLKDIADGDENDPRVRTRIAIVHIYESIRQELVTATFGDVPYFQGGKGMLAIENSFPKYDPQQEIYRDLIIKLGDAIGKLNATDVTFTAADHFYNGDVDRWRRLGNSIRLRTAMRMSEVAPQEAQAAVTAAMQAPLMTTHNHSAVLQTTADNGAGSIAHPILREMRAPDNKSRPAHALVEMLKAKNDPRLTLIAEPTGVSKAVFAQSGNPADLQYKGILPNMTVEQYDAMNLNDLSTVAWDIWANEGRAVPHQVFTASESLFLQAEAALRGWGATEAEAQGLFEAAIRSAMEMEPYNLPTDEIDAYLAVHGTLTGSMEEKLEQIMEEKWVSLWTRDIEAYFEWRRTGYPVLDPGDRTNNTTNGVIPRRAYYSQAEEALNRTNWQEAIARQGADHPLTRMWIDPQ